MDGSRGKIMLVDDNAANLRLGAEVLAPRCDVFPAPSAEEMFRLLRRVRPDVILLDVAMPGIDGHEAIVRLKADRNLAAIPVIFLTALGDDESEEKGFSLGAADYVAKPFSPPLLWKRIESQLSLLRQKDELLRHATSLERRVAATLREARRLQYAMLDAVSDLVEFRGRSASGHNTRLQRYLEILVDALRRSPVYSGRVAGWNLNLILPLAQLHDIGEIGIPDAILNKPGKLTPAEFEIVKTHVPLGVAAVQRLRDRLPDPNFLDRAIEIVGSHHERWDGGGYPAGLAGGEIPLLGRLMAIADAYDALVFSRPYKKALGHDMAREIIRCEAGRQFDPDLVRVFLGVAGEFRRAAQGLTQDAAPEPAMDKVAGV